MNKQPGDRRTAKLDKETLKTFFISHLKRIYGAKAHLVSKLPLLKDEAHFIDLKHAIEETVDDVERQMARMELIFTLLDSSIEKGGIQGIEGLVNDAFETIKDPKADAHLRDMSIIFYLQILESVEMASFQILQMTAVKLKNKQISQLLKENYDEAKADRTLLLLIAAKYLAN